MLLLLLLFTGGEDYLPLVTEVSLNSEQDRICVSVIILEDERIEMDETFRIFVEGFGVSTLVTIIDDDGMLIVKLSANLAPFTS